MLSMILKEGFTFIDNNNINESCLNWGELHLNRRGLSNQENNFKKIVESLWETRPLAKVYINSDKHLKADLNDLRSLQVQYPRNIISSCLNINSIWYKFDYPETIISENIDSRKRMDNSFTTPLFMLPGYQKPYHLDIIDRKEGHFVYIKIHLLSRLLKTLI